MDHVPPRALHPTRPSRRRLLALAAAAGSALVGAPAPVLLARSGARGATGHRATCRSRRFVRAWAVSWR